MRNRRNGSMENSSKKDIKEVSNVKAKSNNFFLIFVALLVILILVAFVIVISNVKKNTGIVPNNKIKEKYNEEGRKEEFLELASKIELAVINRFLDGSVTNDSELGIAINQINAMFRTDNWSLLELDYPAFWMGEWSLDEKGNLHFKFKTNDIKPDWVMDEDVQKYVI